MINFDFSKQKGKISFNDFELDKNISIAQQLDNLKEDMLQVNFPNGHTLDVGWRPSFNENGQFYIYLIKNFEWDKPIFCQTTKRIAEVEDIIQQAINLL